MVDNNERATRRLRGVRFPRLGARLNHPTWGKSNLAERRGPVVGSPRRFGLEGASVALEEQDLVNMSGAELDELFRRSPPGEIPDGEANGQVLVGFENETLSDTAAKVAGLVVWQGKVFDREKGELVNKVGPFGVKTIRAKVYKEPSWFDGKEAIILDYSDTSVVAQWIRDEIREVAPGLYLGLVFWEKEKILRFSLKFPG
jgi:hypothetical protein